MLKMRLNALRTIAFSASLLMGLSAYAKSPAPEAIQFFSPLKMPHYEQWRKLSPKAREEFIHDVQAFLLRADAMARTGTQAKDSREAQIIQRLFDLWIETAEAKTKSKAKSQTRASQQPYCINQGVVRPLSECDTKLGYKMHDFDTNDNLSSLGAASQCQAPEKPCSPFFGFTAEGQMLCSSLNLTRDCKQKSEQPGTISLASTLSACEKGSPGAAKVDCGKLKAFFDQQMDAVSNLCKDAPKKFACGILKDQIQTVMAEKEGKAPAASEATAEAAAPDAGANAASDADENGVPDLAGSIKDAVKMEANKAPCPPEQAKQPSTAPASAQASATATAKKADAPTNDKVVCPHKAYPPNIKMPLFDTLIIALGEGSTQDTVCAEMDLPNHGSFKLDLAKEQGVFRALPNSAPVTVDSLGLSALVFASDILAKVAKVPAANLLASYIPKEIVKDVGKITVTAKSSNQTKEFPATGLVSADGTQIRYAFDEQGNTILLTIKRPGDAKEAFFPIDLNKLQQAQAQAAANQQK